MARASETGSPSGEAARRCQEELLAITAAEAASKQTFATNGGEPGTGRRKVGVEDG